MNTTTTQVEFPELWTTRDGRKLRVSDMEEHHVRAALNMVIRRARIREKRLRLLREIRTILNLTAAQREMIEKHDIDLFPENGNDHWGDS